MRERAAEALLALGLAAAAVISPRAEPWNETERISEKEMEPGQRVALAFGARLGEVTLTETWSDFRGTLVAPGRYGLRYALQPRLKEHVGADAIRDFALLVPAELSTANEARRPEEWIAASRVASGASHPAVMALLPWTGETSPPAETVLGDDIVQFRSIGDLSIGFVVAGRAVVEEAF